MSNLLDAIANAFFPHHCFLCDELLPREQLVCAECRDNAPYILPPICDRCGRGVDVCICGGHTHAYDRCVSPFYHDGIVQDSILQLKSRFDVDVADGFAAEMAEMVRREYGGIAFDTITSVPLHKKDLHQRGFDQAAGIAKALARRMGVPYSPLLTKLTHTQPQKELSAVHRKGNLLGVFDVIAPVEGSIVLLVDDVITTGSTLDECAKMLKIFGAEEVYAVTAAAAGLKKDEK